MTNKILAAIGLATVLAILGGAAYKVIAPPVDGTATGTAVTLSDLPLTSHFCALLGTVGPFSGPSPSSYSVQMPNDAGIAISQLTFTIGPTNVLVIRVDGVDVLQGSPGISSGTAVPPFFLPINPPLIVKPGSLLEIGFLGNNVRVISISGYTFTAAQVGM